MPEEARMESGGGQEGARQHIRYGPRPIPSLVLHSISGSPSSLPFSTREVMCSITNAPPQHRRRRAGSCGWMSCSMHRPLPFLPAPPPHPAFHSHGPISAQPQWPVLGSLPMPCWCPGGKRTMLFLSCVSLCACVDSLSHLWTEGG